MDQLLAEFTSIGLRSEPEPAGGAQPVATIAAPVFDGHGDVALIVAVHPLRPLTQRQIDTVGRRLRSLSDSLP